MRESHKQWNFIQESYSMKYNQSGVKDYSLETLLAIRESLAQNRDSLRPDSWEAQRLEAVKKEIERRLK
jgi:hypothetical protein